MTAAFTETVRTQSTKTIAALNVFKFVVSTLQNSSEKRRSWKLSGLRAPKQFLLPMFVNSEGQLFLFPRKNENCESVAGSENEILGACAASPDTFGVVRFFATLQRDPPPRLVGAIDFSNANLGQLIISSEDPHRHNEYTGPPRWDLTADVFLRETKIRRLVLHQVSFLGTVDLTGARKTIKSVEKTTVGVAKLIGGWPITKEFHSCFISYATKDKNFVERLHDLLTENGVECWSAPESLKIAAQFPESIEAALNKFDKLLLVLSEDSIKSDWVRREVEICLQRERHQSNFILCPIRLDDSIRSASEQWATLILQQRHIGDFREWTDPEKFRKEFDRLLYDLRVQQD